MIIVGNVHKLHNFPPWKLFIEHCLKNGLVRKGELNDVGDMEKISAQEININLSGESSTGNNNDVVNDSKNIDSESDDKTSSEDDELNGTDQDPESWISMMKVKRRVLKKNRNSV